jgi:hypothetical protein
MKRAFSAGRAGGHLGRGGRQRPGPAHLAARLGARAALGWVAGLVLPQLLRGAGTLVVALVLAGGILSVPSSTR